MKTGAFLVVALGAALAAGPGAQAQSIAEHVAAVDDGDVRMSFAAREGVCGDGRGSVSLHWGRGGRSEHWMSDCDAASIRDRAPREGASDVWFRGPVRVVLSVRGGRVSDVETHVGGRWRPAGPTTLDLGTVSAPQATRYLLSLARSSAGDVGREALMPALLADSVEVWPDLLAIARDASLPAETRKSAIFWLGQVAAEAATAGLDEIVADEASAREVREAAIFALSQRPADEGVPALIRVVRTSGDAALRRKALFWLGQTGDPRAIDLFEELLIR